MSGPVTATTPTTIEGVSILTGKKRGEMFELALSREGIEVRRPERPAQHMSWDRVSQWEIEERKGYVLLTLRGQGATTPLVVPGWTLEDLEVLMRDVTSGPPANRPNGSGPAVAAESGDGASVAAVPATPTPAPTSASAPVAEAPAPPPPTRAERRQRTDPGAARRRFPWKALVTVVLLGVLATAVILVLLQSAGIIDWNFLGPVA